MINSINTLHENELRLLDEFVRIANKNNLKYFLIGGTALGAIRHQGFIPWDDDIDIGMKRQEFEKFKSVVNRDLKSEFFFVNQEEVEFTFLKMYLKGTIIESEDVFSDNRPEFIDIFPFDPVRKNSKLKVIVFKIIRRVIHSKKLTIRQCKKAHYMKLKQQPSILNVLLIFLLKFISFFLPFKILEYTRNKIMFKSYSNGDWWINWASPYEIGKERVENPEKVKFTTFEHRSLPIPAEYSIYLSRMYGDFMTLPPDKQRQGHHVKKN